MEETSTSRTADEEGGGRQNFACDDGGGVGFSAVLNKFDERNSSRQFTQSDAARIVIDLAIQDVALAIAELSDCDERVCCTIVLDKLKRARDTSDRWDAVKYIADAHTQINGQTLHIEKKQILNLKRHLRDALVCTTVSIAGISDPEVFFEVLYFSFEQILDLGLESQLLNAFQHMYKHNNNAFISGVAMDRLWTGRIRQRKQHAAMYEIFPPVGLPPLTTSQTSIIGGNAVANKFTKKPCVFKAKKASQTVRAFPTKQV